MILLNNYFILNKYIYMINYKDKYLKYKKVFNDRWLRCLLVDKYNTNNINFII